MKSLFSAKLYVVCLKKCRLTGIICGILLIVCNALLPLWDLLDTLAGSFTVTPVTVDRSLISVGLFLLLPLTAIMLLSAFFYLFRREQSDFYFSLPHKRLCVFLCMLAASFTWLWGAMLLSLLLDALLVLLNPSMVFSALPFLRTFGFFALLSLQVGGFTSLAVTLTGTLLSACIATLVLRYLVPILYGLTTLFLDELVPMLDRTKTWLRFFGPTYWLGWGAWGLSPQEEPSPSQHPVVAGMAIALYVLAAVCYCRRRSEMAGQSAVSRVLQQAFRCAFVLPVVLFAAFQLVVRKSVTGCIIALLFAAACFLVYELATVKNVRRALKTAPLFVLPVLCGALIAGGCYLTRELVFSHTYAPDEIESVRLYEVRQRGLFSSHSSSRVFEYEGPPMKLVFTGDAETLRLTSDALDECVRSFRESGEYESASKIHAVIRLRNGHTAYRVLLPSYAEQIGLMDAYEAAPESREVFLRFPQAEEIQSVTVTYTYLSYTDGTHTASAKIPAEDLEAFWTCYAAEYASADEETQMYVKKGEFTLQENRNHLLTLQITGETAQGTFRNQYCVPIPFKESRQYLLHLFPNE